MFSVIFLTVTQIFSPCLKPKISLADTECQTEECRRTAEMYQKHMIPEVPPCSNYYAHACGNYVNIKTIQPYRNFHIPALDRVEAVEKIIIEYMKKIDRKWPKGFQNARAFYDLCLDEDQMRKEGYNSLQYQLNIIGMTLTPPFHTKTGTRKNFDETLGKIHRYLLRASNVLLSVYAHSLRLDMKQTVIDFGGTDVVPLDNTEEYQNGRLPLPQSSPPRSPPRGSPRHGSLPHGYLPHGSPLPRSPSHRSPPHGTPPHGSPPHGSNPNGSPPHGSPSHGSPTHAIPEPDPYTMYTMYTESRKKLMILVIYHLYQYQKIEVTEEMDEEIRKRIEDVMELSQQLIQMRTNFREGRSEEIIGLKHPTVIKKEIDEILQGGKIQFNFTKYLETLYTGFMDPKLPSVKEMVENENYPVTIQITDQYEFEHTFRILRETSPSVLESLIWWTVVESTLAEGPEPLHQFHKEYEAEYEKIYGPEPTPLPRNVSCMMEFRKYFGKFVGHVLAKETNGRKKKKKVTEMFRYIKQTYEESIQRTEWADKESKEATLKKMQSMTAFIGFEDSLLKTKTIDREYRNINFREGNYFQLLTALYQEKRKKELFALFVTNDFYKKPEQDPANLIGAHYRKDYNVVVIPISEIQFPFYELGLEVLNYATLGYTLAHEIGHSVDKLGSKYNAEGSLQPCWTDDTTKAYDEIIQCFVQAYNNFGIGIPNLGVIRLNGQISVNENIADWQGFNMAMIAYRKYVQKHGPEPKLPSFSDLSSDELFSLSYANQYCVISTLDYLIQTAQSSEHPPKQARVNVVLRNSKQFTDAYKCDAEAPMNAPNKCGVWF